jgi:hypothetical protein
MEDPPEEAGPSQPVSPSRASSSRQEPLHENRSMFDYSEAWEKAGV